MEHEIQLRFFRRLLKGMNISSCMVDDPEHIPSEIDLGLRKDLFGADNYSLFLENSMTNARDYTIYCFMDEHSCKYVFLKLNDGIFFFAGPYLTAFPEQAWLERRAAEFQLTPVKKNRLELYYAGLPILEDENLLLNMMNTLAAEVWGRHSDYTMEYVDYVIHDRSEPIPTMYVTERSDADWSLRTLEQNYANEKMLMEAVSKGKLHQVTWTASTNYNNGTELRTGDSLRNRKNYLIILKTLLRKSAEMGGVHPLHIHRMSSLYANRIEAVTSVKQSFALQEEMIRNYCQLVKDHSLKSYSTFVGQAITLVQYDLAADLSLKAIASTLNVNPSYLSALFHKECGCTLTEYVNRERVNYAMTQLKSTRKHVQDIAADCGFQDTTYFIKLFKKHTGMTPNQYRQVST